MTKRSVNLAGVCSQDCATAGTADTMYTKGQTTENNSDVSSYGEKYTRVEQTEHTVRWRGGQ